MQSVEVLAERLRLNPADREAYQALKALYRSHEDYASLANLVAGWAAWVGDDRAAAAAYVEVGDILASHLNDPVQAETFYGEALTRDPAGLAACDALCALWDADGQYERLQEFLESQLHYHTQHGTAPKQLAVLRYRLGELQGKRLGATTEALQQYKRAIELDPTLLRALYEARQLLLSIGDPRGAAELYEREAAAEPSQERKLTLLSELSALYRDDLDDLDGAVSALQRACSVAGDDPALSYELATALMRRAERSDERSASGDYAQVAELMCVIAAQVTPDQATGYLETALRCAPDHEGALIALERLYEGEQQAERLAPHWVAYVASAPDGAASQRRRVKLARAYARGGQIEDALFCLGPAAKAGMPAALELMEQLEGQLPAGKASPAAQRAPEAPEVNTVVGERDLIESLREATAEVQLVSAQAEQSRHEIETERDELPEDDAVLAASEPDAFDDLEEIEEQGEINAGGWVEATHSPAPAPTPPRSEPPPAPEGLTAAEVQALRRSAAEHARAHREEDAGEAYEEVLRAEPLDREAFAFLDGFYRRKQQHRSRAQLLERSASVEALPIRLRITRFREAASIYESRLKDYDAAIRVLGVLAGIDTEAEEIGRSRTRLLERAGRWDELAPLLEAEIAKSEQIEAKVPLLRRLAAMHRDKRGDRSAAIDVLERLLIVKPDEKAARDALIEDLLVLERYDEIVPWLERKYEEAASQPQKLALLRQLAELCRDRLRDFAQAFRYYERALALAPGDAASVKQLLDMAGGEIDHERLMAVLERQVSLVDGARAAELLVRMAETAKDVLRDRKRSGELLARAVDLAPERPEYLEALCALYEQDGRYEDLVELLRERALIERSATVRVELFRRIARTLEQQLGDAEGARDAWEQLLHLREDREALDALREAAERRGDLETLVKLLGRSATLETDPAQRRDLLFSRAELLAQRLGRPADALADLVRILNEIDLDFAPAFELLRSASQAANESRSFVQILERRLQATTVHETRVEYAKTLADLYEHELHDADAALRTLELWASAEVDDPEPRRRLSPLLSRARRYEALLDVLDDLTRLEPDLRARERAAIAAAEIVAGRLNDPDSALERLAPFVEGSGRAAMEAAITLAKNAGRMPALYDLLERAGQIDRLLTLLRERTSGEVEPVLRAALLRRIAQLLIEYKQDEAGAAEAYRRLIEIEEDGDALRFLQAIAAQKDDPAALAPLLKRLAALEQDPVERRNLWFEHAQLLNGRLDRAAEAIPVLQALLQAEPEFEPAWEGLIQAAERARDHATLAHALERILERTHERSARAQLAARLAQLCERELHDPSRAISALQLWADAEPENPQPHRNLRPHLEAAGRDRELLVSLDALSHREASSEARIEATLAAATLARNRLDDVDGAWRRLLPHLPDADVRVDRALYALATDAGRHDELCQLLEQAGRYQTLIEWLEQRISLERDDATKVALLRRVAHTCSGPIADEQAAADAWARLLRVQEDAEALGFMRARALGQDDMTALGDCLRRLAALEQDPNEKRDLLYEYGHLLRARLGRPEEAIVVLRGVIEALDPEFEPALDELIQACDAVSDRTTLAWALSRALARETDPSVRAELSQRLVELYGADPSQREQAIAAIRAWADAAPNDAGPYRRMAELLASTDRYAERIAALDALAVREDDDAVRERAVLEAAELAFTKLSDTDGAFRRLEPLASGKHEAASLLLARVATEGGRSEALFTFYERQQRYDELVAALRNEAERASVPSQRSALFQRCARLLAGVLNDRVAAAEAYREVLSVGEDEEALRFLREQAMNLDDPVELAEMLQRLAAITSDKQQRRDFLFERALLLADRLEQHEQASAALRSILSDLDPSFAPAIDELIALADASEDYAALAFGLERQLALARTRGAQAELSERLAELYEDKLHDQDKTLAALRAWSAAAPDDPQPLRRLRPALERGAAADALLQVLDALARCEATQDARDEALLAAAELAAGKLGDVAGAWQRLAPLLLRRDESAELAARRLAERSNDPRPLAHLHVLRAQQPGAPAALALQDWLEVAKLYQSQLNEPLEALEAYLRALALDLHNRALLDEIDRLSAATGNWERLARVYGRLVQEAASTEERVELLVRNAVLLEQKAEDPGGALDRVLQACKLAPERDDLLERAENLATRAGSHPELVAIYEALAANAGSPQRRARQLVRAARAADLGLKDREQALRHLAQALALSAEFPMLANEIEELARELDRARPELGGQDARRGLIQAHLDLAQARGEPLGPVLVLRAAQLLQTELSDDGAAFDALKQGATLFPDDLDLYDALERVALRIKRLDALDAHLSRCIQRASQFEVKRALLLRRARLLAEHLQRHAKAAEVYRELLALDPDNAAAFESLLRSLRKAGRFQELLRVYDERLERTKDLETRLALMREVAVLWEVELKNRPSAMEAWRGVQRLAPNDQEASAALSRLGSL